MKQPAGARKMLWMPTKGGRPLSQENFWVQVSSGSSNNFLRKTRTSPPRRKENRVMWNLTRGIIYIHTYPGSYIHIIYTIEELWEIFYRNQVVVLGLSWNPSFSSSKMCWSFETRGRNQLLSSLPIKSSPPRTPALFMAGPLGHEGTVRRMSLD